MFRHLALLLLFVPGLCFGGDASAGKELYAPCVACHGTDGEGNPLLNSPAIAGQSAAYISRQLKNFQIGVRGTDSADTGGAQMRPMAMTLPNEKAVADIAAFVASLPALVSESTVSGNAEKGSKQYIGKCGACHGGMAEGNDALNSPRLVGLSDTYIVQQVAKFQNGIRGAHSDDKYGKQMAMMSKLVSADELNDIVAFINEIAQQP
jgi:cytochrome c553